MDAYTLSQVLAGVALISDATSFQCKKREYILACLVVSASLMTVHFYLLNVYTAAAIGILSIARFTLSIFYVKRWLMWAFLIATAAVAALTFNGILSVLSACATSLFTVGAFQRDDKTLRLLSIAAVCLWIIHNVLAKSVMGTVLELFFLSSCLLGYYRFYMRPKYAA
ncbi:MAG: hypothetical protein RL336_244 [Pseudomonadota bacterium]